MKPSGFRVLVVDDYEPFRRFVCFTLSNQPGLRVVGEASEGLEAIQEIQDLRPDLILLDIGMPIVNGIEAARRICSLLPDVKILFVSQQSSPDLVQAALDTGALGYVLKSDAARELLPAVEAVIRGEVFVSSSLSGADRKSEHQAGREKVVSHFPMRGRRHARRFYSDDAALVDDFAESIETALENGSAVLVVTTESHRADLQRQLKASGVDVDAAAEQHLYVSIDVPDSFSTIMDASTDENEIPKDVRHAILEALQSAKERYVHLSVG